MTDKKKFPPPPASGTGRWMEIPPETGDQVREIRMTTRSRFSVIAEEMGIEDRGEEIVVGPKLIVSGSFDNATDAICCSRCGASAFTRGMVEGVPSVFCRGCPPPAPVYELNQDVKLTLNRYRCSSCGKQDFVTMTLSDVNLYCRGCGVLTLHARQVDQTPRPFARPPKPAMPDWTGGVDDSVVRWNTSPKREAFEREEERRRDETRVWEITVEELRLKLKLEPFDLFAARARDTNMSRDLLQSDWVRQTGRTTKGVIEALAWCVVKQATTMHIRTATVTHDKWLVRRARELCGKAKISFPRDIEIAPRDSVDGLSPKRGVLLYIDHHYHEAVARVQKAEVEVPSGKQTTWTCMRCGRTKLLGWVPAPGEIVRCKCEQERT